jgi:hypothetical protein
MMTFTKKPALLLLFPLLMTFFACFARIDGAVKDGGAADLKLKISLGPSTTALIRSLRLFMGGNADAQILDGQAIGRSLAQNPGVESALFRNTAPQALDGTLSLSKMGDFMASTKGRFITFNEGNGSSSIIVILDRDSAPELISRLSPEAGEYLHTLMAPAVTGEIMTKREYLDLVASIYGRPLSEEISAARIQGTIEFPRPIKAVQGGSFSGKQLEFDILLLDILVLESPLRYEVSW